MMVELVALTLLLDLTPGEVRALYEALKEDCAPGEWRQLGSTAIWALACQYLLGLHDSDLGYEYHNLSLVVPDTVRRYRAQATGVKL